MSFTLVNWDTVFSCVSHMSFNTVAATNAFLNTIYVRLSTRRFARRRRSTRLEFFVRTTGRADATYTNISNDNEEENNNGTRHVETKSSITV